MKRKLGVYEVEDSVYKLKILKALGEIGRLNYVNASKYGIKMHEWHYLIAFANCSNEKNKKKFYNAMNGGKFII